MHKVYSPVSLAVGDFTGAGVTDQLAVVTADADAVWITVYKLLEERVYSYTSSEMRTSLIVSNYSRYPVAQAVAGDFDGDSKTEFAVVFKDDVASQNNVNVTVYKWSNNSFTKANNKVSYDGQTSYTTISALGLKAARADLDGDGKDEIAVLLFIYEDMVAYAQNSESKSLEVFPYLTYWYCDRGSKLFTNSNRDGTFYYENRSLGGGNTTDNP